MALMERMDWADQHVARWRNHWVDIEFDDDVEAITVRVGRIRDYFVRSTGEALSALGLQDFEYQTLHQLMIRDTPGSATPSELAADLGISNAGMTGRLDTLERAGWVQRHADSQDRRRVHIEVTSSGVDIWRRAMSLRGSAEDELLGTLTATERTELATLLKRLTLAIEGA